MPRTLSVEEFKELGKRYYGRKDYQRALDAFKDGIDASVGRDIQLYDYRAACHDKLDDLKGALDDAKHMIRAFEKDPRGHLRGGQILMKMGKKDLALQIYARALRKVPASHPQVELLRGAHDKLNRELCPAKAVDPFTQFPYEVVEMIMSYLKFYEVVSCLRVSKQWKLFLESLPNLWTNMDLLKAGGRRLVQSSFVKACMRMSKNGILSARIANFGSSGMLLLLVKTCQKIERLEFVQTTLGAKSILESVNLARSLKSLIVHEDIEIHGDTITRMLQLRPTLEELRIHQVGGGCSTTRQLDVTCENLRVLDLQDVDYRFEDQHHLSRLLKHAPNLEDITYREDLSCEGCRPQVPPREFAALKNLTHLRVKAHRWMRFPSVNTLSLRVLVYESIRHEVSPYTQVDNGYPFLESISLKSIMAQELPQLLDMYHGNDSVSLPEKPSMLKFVQVSSLVPIDWDFMAEVVEHPRLQEVEELALEGALVCEMDDRDAAKIAKLKHLKGLRLEAARITGVAIKQLVTELKDTLKHITLIACDDVGHDAADWAARQGVEVIVQGTRQKRLPGRRR